VMKAARLLMLNFDVVKRILCMHLRQDCTLSNQKRHIKFIKYT
jgi:hypothetical protein